MITEDQLWKMFQALPEPEPVVLKLYYNDQGEPIVYTCDTQPGNYIEVDPETFAERSMRVRVSNGVLNNYSGISGWYQFPWAGYNTLSTTGGVSAANNAGYSSVQQAWGVWVNPNYGNTYGSTISYNNSNYYYVGLPQITNPLTPLT